MTESCLHKYDRTLKSRRLFRCQFVLSVAAKGSFAICAFAIHGLSFVFVVENGRWKKFIWEYWGFLREGFQPKSWEISSSDFIFGLWKLPGRVSVSQASGVINVPQCMTFSASKFSFFEEEWSGGRHSEVCLKIQEEFHINPDSDHLDQSNLTHPTGLDSEEAGVLCLNIILPIVVFCCLLVTVWLCKWKKETFSNRCADAKERNQCGSSEF